MYKDYETPGTCSKHSKRFVLQNKNNNKAQLSIIHYVSKIERNSQNI